MAKIKIDVRAAPNFGTCKWCNQMFFSAKPVKDFCSAQCMQKHGRARRKEDFERAKNARF